MEVFETFLAFNSQIFDFAKRLCQGCTEILDALQYTEDSLACIFSDSLYSVRLVVAVSNQLASLYETENYYFTGIQNSTAIS